MSTLEVNTINPQSGSTLTLGSSGNTVTLGSGVSGSGFGKIGQVIEATNASMTTNITSTSYVATGLTANITPTATSSKIFVLINFAATMDGGSNGTLGFGAIYNGTSTNVRERLTVYDTDFGNVGNPCSIQALHSPNSTSQQTYNLYVKTLNSSSQFRPNGEGTIILMEVLA
jgi:hypothetical protein